MLAYILARIEAGKDREIFNEIKKLAEIKRASATYGMYDLHIEVEFDTVEELDAFVFNKIKILGIKETVTTIVAEILV